MADQMDQNIEGDVCRQLDAGNFDGAVATALRGYGREVFSYLSAVTREPSIADEAFSQFSEDLWSSMATFRRESSVKTWCYRLAWHAALRVMRDPYRKRGQRIESSEWSKLAEEIRASTAMHLRTEVKQGIAKLRAQLTPDEQTLLILRLDRDLAWRDVAQIMSESGTTVSEASLRKRFERLTEKLRDLARAEGLLPE